MKTLPGKSPLKTTRARTPQRGTPRTWKLKWTLAKWTLRASQTNRVFGKPCFLSPAKKRGRFDENGENDEFFYPLKPRASLLRRLRTTKMTKMAGVTHEKAWFRKKPGLLFPEEFVRPSKVQDDRNCVKVGERGNSHVKVCRDTALQNGASAHVCPNWGHRQLTQPYTLGATHNTNLSKACRLHPHGRQPVWFQTNIRFVGRNDPESHRGSRDHTRRLTCHWKASPTRTKHLWYRKTAGALVQLLQASNWQVILVRNSCDFPRLTAPVFDTHSGNAR